MELHDLEGFFGSIPTINILDAPPTFPPEGPLDDDDFISNLDSQHPFLCGSLAVPQRTYQWDLPAHREPSILPVKHKYGKWLVENAIIPRKPDLIFSSFHCQFLF